MRTTLRGAGGLLLALILLFAAASQPAAAEGPVETPARTFFGTEQAEAVRANLNFADVRASNTFARTAIWETGALELMKGYGATRFGLADTLSVEQALAIAYVAAGREAEAQQAAEVLDARRAADQKLFPAPRMWSDGYIQLAFNDGLLTPAQYADALQTDQLALTGENFLRKASVTREDMAYYLAGVLKLAPLYPQTRLFNSFSDWQTANPVRVPALEAMLQNRIMHGDANGRFRPKGFLTRAEAAQILQNAQPVIFPLLQYTKHKGMVEGVDLQDDWVSGVRVQQRTVRIRNVDGSLHTLTLRLPAGNVAADRNELTGREALRSIDTVVVSDGVPASGTVLARGQQILYVSDAQDRVPHVQVLAGTPVKILLGRVAALDPETREMTFQPYQELPAADMRMVDKAALQRLSTAGATARHVVSGGARIYSGEVQLALTAIQPGDHAIIKLEGGLVTYIEPVNLDLLEQGGVVSGIVADNNPSLGYITLYASDGYGTSAGLDNGFEGLRNLAYAPDVVVRRDGRSVAPDAVLPGDSVFLKLNDADEVWEIGAASDYAVLHGTVRSRSDTTVTLQLRDGTTRTYPLTAKTPVYRNGLPASRADVRAGDRIRLLVQTNAGFVRVGEVRLEKDPIPVSRIYRGTFVWYNPLNGQVTITGARSFTGGRWLPVSQTGALTYPMSSDYQGALPPERARAAAFFAVSEDLGGVERIIAITLREPDQYEQLYDDTLASTTTDGSRIGLMGSAALLATDAGTLVVKDGRLVEASALAVEERARLSAARDAGTGQMRVDVLMAQTPTGAEGLSVYRGRISAVARDGSFTLESFARLDNTTWTFFNTPKTFSTRSDKTRLLSDGGVSSLRAFTEADWVGRSVYVLTDGTHAAVVSDAVYGETVLKGRVVAVEGGVTDSFGSVVSEPGALSLMETRRYNPLTYTWVVEPGGTVTVPGDAIVIRQGREARLADVQPGDDVRVLQTEAGGNARLVVAE